MGTLGRSLGAVDSSYCQNSFPINYIATLVTQPVFVAMRRSVVVDIRGRVIVAGTGGACTISFYKAPSGTALASGTLLHTGSYNLVGTVDANQVMTLAANLDSLTLNVGDCVGYVLTGTATSAVGSVTVTIEPYNG
jgi:hypothetical protein